MRILILTIAAITVLYAACAQENTGAVPVPIANEAPSPTAAPAPALLTAEPATQETWRDTEAAVIDAGILALVDDPDDERAFYELIDKCGGAVAIRDRLIKHAAGDDDLVQKGGLWFARQAPPMRNEPVVLSLAATKGDQLYLEWNVHRMDPTTWESKRLYASGITTHDCSEIAVAE